MTDSLSPIPSLQPGQRVTCTAAHKAHLQRAGLYYEPCDEAQGVVVRRVWADVYSVNFDVRGHAMHRHIHALNLETVPAKESSQ